MSKDTLNILFFNNTSPLSIVRRNKPLGNDKHPWKAEVTEGDAGVSDATITNWFKAVYEPAYAGD